MSSQSKKAFKSYMKPVQKRVTIQKPQQKLKVDAAKTLPDGFSKVGVSRIRKIYK